MAQHRTLIEGMKATPTTTTTPASVTTLDHAKEREIVYGSKAVTTTPAPKVRTAGLNTRVREDLFAILKRVSLQRQLDEVEPNTIADIVAEALQHWLKANGYFE